MAIRKESMQKLSVSNSRPLHTFTTPRRAKSHGQIQLLSPRRWPKNTTRSIRSVGSGLPMYFRKHLLPLDSAVSQRSSTLAHLAPLRQCCVLVSEAAS